MVSPRPAGSTTTTWSPPSRAASTERRAVSSPTGGRRTRRRRASWSTTTPSRPTSPGVAQPHQPRRRPVGPVGGQPGARRWQSSRLFQEVREERGLAYSVYPHPTAFADSGYLTIYCGTAPKRARETLDVIDDVSPPCWPTGSQQELAVAAGYLEGSMLLGLEDSGSRMGRLGRSLMQRDEITPIDEHVARLRPSPLTTCRGCCTVSSTARHPRGPRPRSAPSSLVVRDRRATSTLRASTAEQGDAHGVPRQGSRQGQRGHQGGPGRHRQAAVQAQGRRAASRARRLDLRQAQGRLRRRRREHRSRARRAGRPRGRARRARRQGGAAPPPPRAGHRPAASAPAAPATPAAAPATARSAGPPPPPSAPAASAGAAGSRAARPAPPPAPAAAAAAPPPRATRCLRLRLPARTSP